MATEAQILATRNPQLATRNPQLATRNPQLPTRTNQPIITNYAKQTQFPKSSNERKYCYNKGL